MSHQDWTEITALLYRWGQARDSDDWGALAGCYHDGATMNISWISDQATQFVARSRAMAENRAPGAHTKHVMASPWIEIKGDKAFGRINVNLFIRSQLDGQEFDIQSWFRFFDLLEKREGRWGIVKRTAVYEKDRFDACDPRGVPADFFEDMDLSGFPDATKYLNYYQKRGGREPRTDVVTVFSAEERALREEGYAWIGP